MTQQYDRVFDLGELAQPSSFTAVTPYQALGVPNVWRNPAQANIVAHNMDGGREERSDAWEAIKTGWLEEIAERRQEQTGGLPVTRASLSMQAAPANTGYSGAEQFGRHTLEGILSAPTQEVRALPSPRRPVEGFGSDARLDAIAFAFAERWDRSRAAEAEEKQGRGRRIALRLAMAGAALGAVVTGVAVVADKWIN